MNPKYVCTNEFLNVAYCGSSYIYSYSNTRNSESVRLDQMLEFNYHMMLHLL